MPTDQTGAEQPAQPQTAALGRKSNIELLRIVTMLLIIAHHLVLHGGIFASADGDLAKAVCSGIFLPGGKIGFDCFIFISAWFMAKKPFSGHRYLKVALEAIFYNLLGMALTVLLGNGLVPPVTPKEWIGCFLPLLGITHGFAVYYMLFLILLPFLQKATEKMSGANLAAASVVLFLAEFGTRIISRITGYAQLTDIATGLGTFVVIYFISVYLQRRPIKLLRNKPLLIGVFALCWGFVAAVQIAASFTESPVISAMQGFSGGEMSPVNILAGLCLFMLFEGINLKTVKAVNFVSGHTLGVLMLHDHNYFRYVIWQKVCFANKIYPLGAPLQLLYVIGVSAAVFAVCTAFDMARTYLLEKPISKTKPYKKLCGALETCFKF